MTRARTSRVLRFAGLLGAGALLMLAVRLPTYEAGVALVAGVLDSFGVEWTLLVERGGALVPHGFAHGKSNAVTIADKDLDLFWGAWILWPALVGATPATARQRVIAFAWGLPALVLAYVTQLTLWSHARFAQLVEEATAFDDGVLHAVFVSAPALPVVVWLPWAWRVWLGDVVESRLAGGAAA